MKKILVLEDDKDLSDAISLILSGRGYQIKVINDPDSIREFEGFNPDLILLDLSVIEIFKKISGNEKIISPVIIVSGKPEGDLKDFQKSLNAVDFLQKPFDMQDLLNKVKENI
jgi:DNA-binding response OmpR family regulator